MVSIETGSMAGALCRDSIFLDEFEGFVTAGEITADTKSQYQNELDDFASSSAPFNPVSNAQVDPSVGEGVRPGVPQKYVGAVVRPAFLAAPEPGSRAVTRAALHSLSHSGLFQAARASRKMFNLKGRNFRFEYTAKTGICGEAHFGNSRMSAPLASASSQ